MNLNDTNNATVRRSRQRGVKSEAAPPYAALPATRELTDAEILARASEILARQLGRGDAMTDPAAAGRYCSMQIHGRDREVFAVMFLDTRHRLIAFEELFFGTIDRAEVHPREVVKAALKHNAAAVILAHNHPGGSPEPSAADRAITARLKQALALVDVRLLDHFIVAPGSAATSMAARGWA